MRKKIIYGVCMLGLVALVATSCKKNEENANSFTASFGTLQEDSIDGDDRAYIDPNNNLTLWQNGDKVKVFNCENGNTAIYVTHNGGGQNIAQFNNIGGNLGYASKYYSFYPADMAEAAYDFENGGYQKFVLKDEQRIYSTAHDQYYVCENSIPQAACEVNRPNMLFKHKIIFGMAKFSIKCDKGEGNVTRYVEKIVVKDNHFNLHGTVTLKPDKIDTQKLEAMMGYLRAGGVDNPDYKRMWTEYVIDELGYSAQGAGRVLTMDYTPVKNYGPGGIVFDGVSLGMSRPSEFFICLRPGALAYGFILEIWVNDGGTPKKIVLDQWDNVDYSRAIWPARIKNFTKNEGFINITELVNNWQPGDND